MSNIINLYLEEVLSERAIEIFQSILGLIITLNYLSRVALQMNSAEDSILVLLLLSEGQYILNNYYDLKVKEINNLTAFPDSEKPN